MKSNYSPRIRSLLLRADKVAKQNRKAVARQMYHDLLKEAPDVPDAWCGLAETSTNSAEAEKHYLKALEIDPSNQRAKAGLRGDVETQPTAPDAEDAALAEEVKNVPSKAAPSLPPTVVESVGKFSAADESHSLESDEAATVCKNHPRLETNLRCNRCNEPICIKCAKKTAVGYRCPQCIKETQDTFFTATPVHYLIAAAVTLFIAPIAALLASYIGFFTIFVAAAAGSFIGSLVFKAMGRKRGRYIPYVVVFCMLLGGLLPGVLVLLAGGGLIGFSFWTVIFIVISSSSAFYQLK